MKKEEEKKEIKILDFKDYIPPKLEEMETEYRTHILEDIKGTKFNFKHKVPSTSEILEFKRVNTVLNGAETHFVIDQKKAFNFITKKIEGRDFNCLPVGIPIDVLTEESIKELVNGFCRRV